MHNRRGTLEIASATIIKGVLAICLIVVLLSFFSRIIPVLSDMPIISKVIIVLSIMFLYHNIMWIIIHMGWPK